MNIKVMLDEYRKKALDTEKLPDFTRLEEIEQQIIQYVQELEQKVEKYREKAFESYSYNYAGEDKYLAEDFKKFVGEEPEHE